MERPLKILAEAEANVRAEIVLREQPRSERGFEYRRIPDPELRIPLRAGDALVNRALQHPAVQYAATVRPDKVFGFRGDSDDALRTLPAEVLKSLDAAVGRGTTEDILASTIEGLEISHSFNGDTPAVIDNLKRFLSHERQTEIFTSPVVLEMISSR